MDFIIPLVSVMLGAALAWITTIYFNKQKRFQEQKNVLVALYGELQSIKAHYEFSASEMPASIETSQDLLLVELAKYGEPSFSKSDFVRFGFLTEGEIGELIQLGLKMRNTDIALKEAANQFERTKGASVDLSWIKARMVYLRDIVNTIIMELKSRNPKLKDAGAAVSLKGHYAEAIRASSRENISKSDELSK